MKKILIADDSQAIIDMLTAGLRTWGYHVEAVQNGEDAIRSAHEGHPDLILLDHEMPLMSGSKVCEKLKADPATKSIPIIMVTGVASSMRMEDIADLPTDEFVAKPFKPADLKAKIERLIGAASSS